MGMYYVYILYSRECDKFYIGQTNNMDDRLKRHNAGEVRSTSPYRPWELSIIIEKASRSEAMLLEKKLKNLSKERIIKFIGRYK